VVAGNVIANNLSILPSIKNYNKKVKLVNMEIFI